jgi:hypothetical protein
MVDHIGGLKESSDAAAKLAELGKDYDFDYIEPDLSLSEELLMQIRSQAARLETRPVECHFSGLAGIHDLKAFQIVVDS